MATIKVSNLHPIGTELFFDSESYMSELNDEEIYSVNGGLISTFCNTTFTTIMIPVTKELVKRYLRR